MQDRPDDEKSKDDWFVEGIIVLSVAKIGEDVDEDQNRHEPAGENAFQSLLPLRTAQHNCQNATPKQRINADVCAPRGPRSGQEMKVE